MLPGFSACVLLCLQIGLVPGLSVGMGDGGPGCFAATGGVTRVSPLPHRTQYFVHFPPKCRVVSAAKCNS